MFQFRNVNPLGKFESDCVCRAIKDATGLEYYEVEEKLHLIAELFNCETLCVCCYRHLLENVFGLTPISAQGMTVHEIATAFSDKIVLIRLNGHLTVSKYGIIYDLWDCREEIADIFWIVE
jgi:hypothetical protein